MDALKHAVDYGIIGLLLILSVWSVAVAVERWLFYRHVDLKGFTNALHLEIALTKRLVGSEPWRLTPLHRAAGHRSWDHADFSHHGNVRNDGGEHDHDRAQPGVKSNSGRPPRGHSVCGDEQRAPSARDRITNTIQGGTWNGTLIRLMSSR